MNTTIDGRRARGDRSRSAVLELAVDIASIQGLDGLTIGTLAAGASLSKSGVVALFGTKEQLQLATIDAAREIFTEQVVRPAMAAAGGMERLRALLDGWLRYSESRVFAGGCFFEAVSRDVSSEPGPVRDALVETFAEWSEFVRGAIQRAVDTGELEQSTDVAQLEFEARSLLTGANAQSLLAEGPEPYRLARRGLQRLLGSQPQP